MQEVLLSEKSEGIIASGPPMAQPLNMVCIMCESILPTLQPFCMVGISDI